MSNIAAFRRICGNCDGLDLHAITERDIREQAIDWAHSDDEMPSEAEIEDAILGLRELQDQSRTDSLF